jgi:hypothetical protein
MCPFLHFFANITDCYVCFCCYAMTLLYDIQMPATGCYNGQSINLPINDLTLKGLRGYCNIIYWMCAAAHREISRGAHLYNKVCRLSCVFCMVCVHRAFVLIFSASFLARALGRSGARKWKCCIAHQAGTFFHFSGRGISLIRTPTGSCACIQSVALQMEQRNAAESAAARLHANHARTRECTFAFH